MPHEEPVIPKPEQIGFFEHQVTEARKEADKFYATIPLVEAGFQTLNELIMSPPTDYVPGQILDDFDQATSHLNRAGALLDNFNKAISAIDMRPLTPYDVQIYTELLVTLKDMFDKLQSQREAMAVVSAMAQKANLGSGVN